MENREYAIKVLNELNSADTEANTDLLEEGLARLFSTNDDEFEQNLKIIQEWVYTESDISVELIADILLVTGDNLRHSY